MLSQPLTELEFDRLQDLLQQAGGVHGMNVEAVDGFFTALVCGPELVLPSEYLPEIWRGDSDQGSQDNPLPFDTVEQCQEVLDLLTRHWNSIVATLSSGEIFVPALDSDEDGIAHGNDWAWGFMCGVELRHDAWLEVFDEDNMQLLIPILALFYENDPDPELRPYQGTVSKELREQLIVGLSLSAMEIYKHFQPARRRDALQSSGAQRSSSKVGRNQMCPCGSGKKYKRCCGNQTVQ